MIFEDYFAYVFLNPITFARKCYISCARLIIPWQRCVVKHETKYLKILETTLTLHKIQNYNSSVKNSSQIASIFSKTKHVPSCLSSNCNMFIWSVYTMQIILIKYQGNYSTVIWSPYIGKNDFHIYLSYNGQTGINELSNFLKAPSKAVQSSELVFVPDWS